MSRQSNGSRLDDPVMDLQLKMIDQCINIVTASTNVLEAVSYLQTLKTTIEGQKDEYDY